MKIEREKVLWVAKQLYERGLVTGSTGNISFKEKEYIHISQSGSCFGLLNDNSFAKITLNQEIIEGKPSKEYPLHTALYNVAECNQVVIHTHSFYSTLVSCLKDDELAIEGLFSYSPYLKIKTSGHIKKIDYHQPGSKELFGDFTSVVDKTTKVYILSNHGIVVTANDIIECFNVIEEFEVSSRLFLTIKQFNEHDFKSIK